VPAGPKVVVEAGWLPAQPASAATTQSIQRTLCMLPPAPHAWTSTLSATSMTRRRRS
jgi:hypothetical protein